MHSDDELGERILACEAMSGEIRDYFVEKIRLSSEMSKSVYVQKQTGWCFRVILGDCHPDFDTLSISVPWNGTNAKIKERVSIVIETALFLGGVQVFVNSVGYSYPHSFGSTEEVYDEFLRLFAISMP
jgi:hypothetical protein